MSRLPEITPAAHLFGAWRPSPANRALGLVSGALTGCRVIMVGRPLGLAGAVAGLAVRLGADAIVVPIDDAGHIPIGYSRESGSAGGLAEAHLSALSAGSVGGCMQEIADLPGTIDVYVHDATVLVDDPSRRPSAGGPYAGALSNLLEVAESVLTSLQSARRGVWVSLLPIESDGVTPMVAAGQAAVRAAARSIASVVDSVDGVDAIELSIPVARTEVPAERAQIGRGDRQAPAHTAATGAQFATLTREAAIVLSGVVASDTLSGLFGMGEGARGLLPTSPGASPRGSNAADEASGPATAVSAPPSDPRWMAAFVRGSPDAILTVSRDASIQSWNPAAERLFGYSAAEAIGQPITLLAPEPHLAEAQAMFARMFSAGRGDASAASHQADRPPVRSMDTVRCHRDGTPIPVKVSLSPLEDVNGRVFAVAAIVLDQRPRLEAEAALAEARDRTRALEKMQALSRMAGGVAHDLNNMLMVMLSGVTSSLDLIPANTPAAEILQDVLEACDRTRRLSRRMVTISTQHPIRPEPTPLRAALRDLLPSLEARLGPAWPIELRPGDDEIVVALDSPQLADLLGHLVDNARGASPHGSRIILEVRDVDEHLQTELPARDMVELRVSDFGKGMDAAVRVRAFEPFFTTQAFGHGEGLGLALVYGMMRSLGGEARILSEPGVGTTVSLFFPVLDRPIQAARGGPVLLAVQEPSVRASARRVLERAGLSVVELPVPPDTRHLSNPALSAASMVVADTVWDQGNALQVVTDLRGQSPHLGAVFLVDDDPDHTRRVREHGQTVALPLSDEALHAALAAACPVSNADLDEA